MVGIDLPAGCGEHVRDREDRVTTFNLFVVLRTVTLEERDDELLFQSVRVFLEDARARLSREGMLEISHRSGYLLVNGRRLTVDFRAFHATRHLVDLFQRHRIGGVRFHPGLTEEEVVRTVETLTTGENRRPEELAAALAEVEAKRVELLPAGDSGVDPLAIRPREQARRIGETHFRSLFITKRIQGAIRPREGLDTRLAKRIIHGIVDLLLEDSESLAALTELKAAGETLFDHSLNVALIAVLIGREMGLPRRLLGSLGTAGLFHDFGLTGLTRDLPGDVHSWSRKDKLILKNHPVEGFLSLLEGRSFSDLALRNAIVAWEHHFMPAGEGEESRERGRPRPMLLSRIVSVADTFEVLCSVGVQGEPLTTREALEQLEDPLAEHYDQDAVAALKGALLPA